MLENILCPNCHNQITAQDSVCEHCGVNLGLAVSVAESGVARNIQVDPNRVPLAPEILVPRLGDYLVQAGFLSEADLSTALQHQKVQAEAGTMTLIGETLVTLNLITREDLDRAVTEQILSLQEALRKTNQELEFRVQERTAELQQALLRLTELNQLKTQFISNISHELRTPLAHMIGYIDLLAEEDLGPLNEEQKHGVSVLNKSYKRLSELIENLIQFSMMSQGEMSLESSEVDATILIQSAISEKQPLATQKDISLIANTPSDLVKVKCDAAKLSWVFEELLENAIKFQPEGGEVHIHAALNNGLVEFQIADSGKGIPENRIDEIFEPFHQLDGGATRQQGGTGIGLALVKQIVEAHGAIINVTSKAGQGAQFSFSLPAV